MTKDKNPDPEKPVPADKALWAAVTRDIKPLPGRVREEAPEDGSEMGPGRIVIPPPRSAQSTPSPRQSNEMDKKTREKLERGKLRIEGRLDLHGFTHDRARAELESFIRLSYEKGLRCVLVITGKGAKKTENPDVHVSAGGGLLKRSVPEWLGTPGIAGMVLRIHPARAQHGGEGALYVYLRKNKG
ncbi:MAG: Smr/MutS family protein [Alphaproteobacteria bacterium]|nr:Smr/MutS family protein [Alphaproteobacteria bacterium]